MHLYGENKFEIHLIWSKSCIRGMGRNVGALCMFSTESCYSKSSGALTDPPPGKASVNYCTIHVQI